MLHRGPEIVTASLAALEDYARQSPASAFDDRQLRIVQEIADRFEANVLPRLAELPWAVIHHDLHDANVVLDETGTEVAGVIDFNDAVRAPRISDLAICAGYAMLRQIDTERTFRAVVAGYRSVLEPTPAELAVVREMALMRLCMNWAQWQSRALSIADNEYALTRSKFTWPVIDHFAQVSPPTVND